MKVIIKGAGSKDKEIKIFFMDKILPILKRMDLFFELGLFYLWLLQLSFLIQNVMMLDVLILSSCFPSVIIILLQCSDLLIQISFIK